MNMIEKVARAIAEQDYIDNPYPHGKGDEVKEAYINRFWKHSITQARAAIEAMRDPSDEMLSSADCFLWSDIERPAGDRFRRNDLKSIYLTMIDKALEG